MKKRGFSVRPATEEDLAQVAGIEKKTIRPPWSTEQFQQEVHKKFSHFWVVTDDLTDEKVLAYIVFSFPAEQAHIQTIAVDPEMQRSGIGIFLLRQVISFVMRKSAESIILEVRAGNAPALQLYQKLGFIIIRTLKKFYPDGEDAFVMIYKTDRTNLQQTEDSSPDAEPDRKKNFN
jgi:[ribosomal protein S18]-alanine N-acetyltransferase